MRVPRSSTCVGSAANDGCKSGCSHADAHLGGPRTRRIVSELLPGSENWLPLVALLWLASGGLLVFSALKYFASTAANRTERESAEMRPFVKAPASEPRLFELPRDASFGEPQHRVGISAARPAASSDDRPTDARGGDDGAATVAAAPAAPSFGHDAASVRERVRARLARDRSSAQGLRELIRALYLDQSNFTFDTLAGLEAEDRALARTLVEVWLNDPSAVDAWKALYDTTIREEAP